MTTDEEHRLKIAYVIPGTDVSGGIGVVCQHANRLQGRGHETLLVAETNGRSLDWFPGQSVPVIGLPDLPSDVDCLVATGWQTSFRVATLPARHKFYFVQSDETRFHPAGSPWANITRLSYMLDVNFLTEARWIQRWLSESFQKDAELVPNGLDEAIFFPSEPLAPKGRRARVLIEGAINLPYKGMAEAYAAVANEDVDIWVVSSLGRPPKHWRIDRYFEQVPMSEMRRIYSSCDILLKLSRVEGFFGPPMEMMACGGAVVVARVTGFDEYIHDGENALVVDPERPEAATAAVRRLVEDPELRASLVRAGRQTAQAWRWEPTIDILERYYRDVVVGRRGLTPSGAASQRSFSISYFYGLLRGEVWTDPGDSSSATERGPQRRDAHALRSAALLSAQAKSALAADPTEKLIDRLREERWFRAVAVLLYRTYQAGKSLRQRLRAFPRGG
jgi:glycosyltransferase involved in cell wall biosynthesis